MLKILTSAAAVAAVSYGSYAYHQYQAVGIELNQAQAELRVERARNIALSTAAQNVVTAVSTLQQALAQNADKPTPADDSIGPALATVAQER